MADTAASVALTARRNEVFRFTMVVDGIDMTGVPMSMQVRRFRGAPGAAPIQLDTVQSLAAEGLKFDSVSSVGGSPRSVIRGRINKATMSDQAKVPVLGPRGADTPLAYAMQWTLGGDANTRVEGPLIVRDTAYGSDNAPLNRPIGDGSDAAQVGSTSGSLTFGDQVIHVTIDGADLLGPVVEQATAQLEAIEATVAQAAEAQAALTDLIDQYGYRYNYVTTPTQFTDSIAPINRGTHFETSPQARTLLQTAATRIRVHCFTSIAAPPFESFAEVGLLVGGSYFQSLLAAGNGLYYADLTLPEGSKALQIVAGLTSKGGGGTRGTWPVSIEANAPIAQVFPALVNPIYLAGDSIVVGDHTDIVTRRSSVALMRASTSRNIIVDGAGFATFADFAGSPAARDAVVARILASGAKDFYDALGGQNDYALSAASPTTYAAAKVALYEALRAAIPDIRIFAQTAIIMKVESTTVNTFHLQDFRDALASVATGRPWVTIVDGKAFMTAAALHDNVHPNTYGQLLQAQGWGRALNIVVPDPPVSVDPLNAGPDANGAVTSPSAGVYRYTKTAGGNGFNAGAYGPLLAGDFHYKINLPVPLDGMIGVSVGPSNISDYGDMIHQVYPQQGGGIAIWDGAANVGPAPGNYVPGDPQLGSLHIRRIGSSLNFRLGESYDSAVEIRPPVATTGPIGLDMSVFRVGEYVDVRRLI